MRSNWPPGLRAKNFVAVVVVAAFVGPACLFGELSDIPCNNDGQCPGDHFCDIPNDSCLPTVDGLGAADLIVSGVRDLAGATVSSPRVPRDVDSELGLVVLNQGGRAADNIEVRMIPLACMNLRIDTATVPLRIEAGAEAEITFTVRPDDCGTPAIQDWFLFYSGRGTRGTFNILPDRPPPPGE